MVDIIQEISAVSETGSLKLLPNCSVQNNFHFGSVKQAFMSIFRYMTADDTNEMSELKNSACFCHQCLWIENSLNIFFRNQPIFVQIWKKVICNSKKAETVILTNTTCSRFIILSLSFYRILSETVNLILLLKLFCTGFKQVISL